MASIPPTRPSAGSELGDCAEHILAEGASQLHNLVCAPSSRLRWPCAFYSAPCVNMRAKDPGEVVSVLRRPHEGAPISQGGSELALQVGNELFPHISPPLSPTSGVSGVLAWEDT